MSNNFFVELGLIFFLVLLNGVFSMSEMALISARKARLQQRAEEGNTGARSALELSESPTRFLSTIQIGITLISILTGALGGATLSNEVADLLSTIPLRFFQEQSEAIAVVLIVITITYLSLVLGELAPKRVALSNPEGIAGMVAGPMSFLSRLTSPLVALLSVSTEAVLRLLRIKTPQDPPVTPEEITVLMEQGEQSGIFEETETDIVEAVFRLGDLRAGALMTPRPDIDWLDINDPIEENLRYVIESQHTHLPVADGSLDNVIGILRAKDLLSRVRDQVTFDLSELILPAQFVPETTPAFQLLETLRLASGNLVMVFDEYGGTVGMVTLFDVTEAIVGSISLAGEPVIPEAVQRDDGSWLVEGMMRIDTLKNLLDIDLLPDEDRAGYQTVGGFIMAQAGSIPTPGDRFAALGWEFEVMDMDGRRVDKVLISREA